MIALLALLAGPASAGDAHLVGAGQAGASDVQKKAPDDAVAKALVAELERDSKQLKLPDAPDLYHLRYHVMQLQQVDAQASFGAIVRESTDPYSALGIELRVGSAMYDNTGFGGWQNGFAMTWLPEKLTPESIRLDAWRATDRAYKQAVEQYARKKAQFTAPPDYPGDYLLTGATVADGGQGKPVDASLIDTLARKVSSAFRVDPDLDRGEIYVGQEAGGHWIVDTEGTRVLRPVEECTIRAVAQARSKDGLLVSDSILWTVRRPDQLPPVEEMQKQVAEMAKHVVAVTKEKPLEDEYVGPVMFEGNAAVDLFRYLLVPQLEGTPAEVPFDAWFGELASTSGVSVRVGRRVLPDGWTVNDDPTKDLQHPAGFLYDMEGTPAQSVDLVTDGIVRTLLMSRVPRKELSGSNGHARGNLGDRAAGRAAEMTVTPTKAESEAKMLKKALKIAAEYGHDHVLVVRELQDPAAHDVGGSGGFMIGGDEQSGAFLPRPLEVVRVFADGREEPLRGAQFTGVHRWVLRDVAAAGPQVSGSFMASPDGSPSSSLAPTQGMPTKLSVPEVLIGEMELVPEQGDPRDVPVVPPPPLSGGK